MRLDMQKRRREQQRGFTLTETAIVLLCVGLVVSAIWVAADKVWDNYRVYRAVQQADSIILRIREQYNACQGLPPDSCSSPSAATGADETAAMDALNLFPTEMRRSPDLGPGGSPVDDVFSNSVTSGAAPANGSFHLVTIACPTGTGVRCFQLNFLGLNQEACIKMLTMTPISTDIGIVGIGVSDAGGGGVTMNNADIIAGFKGAVILPIQVTQAAVWCADAGVDIPGLTSGITGTNSVFWNIKLQN